MINYWLEQSSSFLARWGNYLSSFWVFQWWPIWGGVALGSQLTAESRTWATTLRASRRSSSSQIASLLAFSSNVVTCQLGSPISAGMTASLLYTSRKGDSLMDECGVVLYAHRMRSSCSAYFHLASSRRYRSPHSITLLAASAWPLVWRCSTDVLSDMEALE